MSGILLKIILITSVIFSGLQSVTFQPTANQYMRAHETFDALYFEDADGYTNIVGAVDIPSLGIHIPIYEIGDGDSDNAQGVIDNESVAALLNYSWLAQPVICDHDYQAFRNLSEVSVGDKMRITSWKYGNFEYVCTKNTTGINRNNDIVSDDGVSYATEFVGDFVLYTCSDSGGKITLTAWKKIE